MADIKKYSSDLDMLRQVFSTPRRRKLLRKLEYEIDLPTYSKNRILCLERRREIKANNEAFNQGVIDLFDEMSSWQTQGMDLTLTASSPMDRHRRSSELGCGLSDKRWSFEDNYLTLDTEVSLPQLPFVEGLMIANARRSLHPSAIGKIISSLPSLERLTMELNAPKAKRVEMQDEHRSSLANALESPSLSNLRTLNIYIEQDIPYNQSFKNRPTDPQYPDGDVLNTALRKLAEDTHLTTLNLTGWWLVSPALFNTDKTFPYLQKVQIQGALITYDGRWYYNGNPADVEPSYDSSRDDDDDEDSSDSDSNSSFNSEFQDSIPEYREALLNGENPHYMWRTQPDLQMFDPLMKTMATAILRMPRLRNFSFSIGWGYIDENAILFEYLKPRERPESFEYRSHELDMTRCYVTLMPEARWEVPSDVSSLWKEAVGDQGIVAVEPY
ncbi:hypothetical protein BDV38DRAFT_268850 [Aspergillus pseudotamarii]|uniref:F-box domain-containing protein n=1 Tax=Aspergillus pseudotamarii TaxID=132259 RepID=A0A5N6T2Z3_ASPPS|nr:uncharacterized protein BDV38DRAFT_268850 [Aspergillus pseudotamarii]KAE8140676.1 hypothetical protein BDV38DRAFT_268850 [Aspergillus pseudotamarii]